MEFQNYHQGIKLHIIYFSPGLTDMIRIRTVIILFSIQLPCIHTHQIRLMNFCGICDLFT